VEAPSQRPRATGAGPSLSTELASEPVRLGPEIGSVESLLEALDLRGLPGTGFLPLGPRTVLLHALVAEGGALALRWVHLDAPRPLEPGGEPADLVVVLTGTVGTSGQALRLVGLLRAALARPAVASAARRATTRRTWSAPSPTRSPRRRCPSAARTSWRSSAPARPASRQARPIWDILSPPGGSQRLGPIDAIPGEQGF
jgi:hypothetical protein